MKLVYSVAASYVMTGIQYCAVQSTTILMQLQALVLHGVSLLHPHLMRRMMYSGASSVFTGRYVVFSVFHLVSFIQLNSSGSSSDGSFFSNERHTVALVMSYFNILFQNRAPTFGAPTKIWMKIDPRWCSPMTILSGNIRFMRMLFGRSRDFCKFPLDLRMPAPVYRTRFLSSRPWFITLSYQ